MRIFVSLLASTAMLFVATMASSFQFETSVSTSGGTGLGALAVNDVITVDIRMINNNNDAIGAIGALAFGFDTSVVQFQSGTAVGKAMATSLLDLGGSGLLPQGGIDSNAGTAGAPPAASPLATPNRNLVGAGGNEVLFFNGINAVLPTPTTTSHLNDVGITGLRISEGDIHAQLVFAVVGIGSTNIEIGPDGINGAVILGSGQDIGPAANATLGVTVVPEPGSAILMGLGLAGLGFAGRRVRE